jgi:hypothetical protein
MYLIPKFEMYLVCSSIGILVKLRSKVYIFPDQTKIPKCQTMIKIIFFWKEKNRAAWLETFPWREENSRSHDTCHQCNASFRKTFCCNYKIYILYFIVLHMGQTEKLYSTQIGIPVNLLVLPHMTVHGYMETPILHNG